MDATQTRSNAGMTPQEFLDMAGNAGPGWSDEHGGPLGIAALAVQMQQDLAHQSEQIAAIRAAAIQEELKARSGTDLARTLGISKAAISRVSKLPTWAEATW